MPKYRKQPVVIEAHLFLPELTPWPEGVKQDPSSPTGYGIFTLENTAAKHEVTPRDFIITGVSGERYPCKSDIFRLTYVPVDADGDVLDW